MLTNEGEGFSSFSFSTSAVGTSAVQADSGGTRNLNATTTYRDGDDHRRGQYRHLRHGSGRERITGRLANHRSRCHCQHLGRCGCGWADSEWNRGDNDAIANITNGSVTTAATANGAVGVSATSGGQVTSSGTTINSNANGSQGLFVTGSGSSLTGSDLTVTAGGNNDPVTGFYSGAASNNAFDDEFPTGGHLSLSNSTLTTTGTQAFGVFTADQGVTTLTDDTITTKGDDPFAGAAPVDSARGGQTIINSGSVMTQGANSIAVYATGAGSTVTANPPGDANGLTITTTGTFSNGVQADTGGAVILNGGSVTTSGPVSEGLVVLGAGSTITASGVAVTTHGDSDEKAQEFATGIFAFTGGSMTFSGGSITTTGLTADAVAVLGSGASVALDGGPRS